MGLFTPTVTPAVKNAEPYLPAPPPGQHHSVAVPGTKQEGRSAVYRHWRIADGPLMTSLDPDVRTAHDFFETTVKTLPTNRAFGRRPYDPVTKKFGDYVWEDYQTVARRRENLGKGLVELHREAGVVGMQHGVGLWCQNRPEWQITGKFRRLYMAGKGSRTDFHTRSGMHVTIPLQRLYLRHTRP